MKKGHFFLFLGFLLLGGAIFWGGKLISSLPKITLSSALEVNTIPEARVILNDQELGRTPFQSEKLIPGEYTLRLLPDPPTAFWWERKIKLNPRLLTYVSYIFGQSERESAGEILTLEKIASGKGETVFLSDPDGASFSLDGKEEGITPRVLSDLGTGEHEIIFFFSGYHDRSVKVKTRRGYKLLVNVKLAAVKVEERSALATESAALKIRILDTPTGFLRIRSEPSLLATETAKVKPGEEYPLLEKKGEWLKIEYEKGKEGWVSSQFVQELGDF